MHEVETMAYAGEAPWHGIGTKIIDPVDQVTPDRFLVKAGLDWSVELAPLVTRDQSQETTYNAVRRVEDQAILGVVGPDYRPLQNRLAFRWFAPFLDSGLAKLEAGGALKGGAVVWGLAKCENLNAEVRPGDGVNGYILLSHGHNGFHCVRVGFTAIRVVCMNTLRMAHNTASSQLIRMKHTSGLALNMERVGAIMDAATQDFKASALQYQLLANSKSIKRTDVEKYVKIVIGVADTKDQDIPTRTKNKIEEMADLAYNGKGNGGNSWWDAYNGVTEYITHSAGRTTESRLDSAWFGAGRELNQKALEVAVELATAA